MQSLTHVVHWDEDLHRWKEISAEEAVVSYGRKVSAAEHVFVCDICNQYVLLAYGEKNCPHFRHNSAEENKNCEERTFNASGARYLPKECELPLRLNGIDQRGFFLELGFLYVPEDILQEQEGQKIKIWLNDSRKPYTYLVERLQEGSITYLFAGEIPAKSYTVEAGAVLANYWPKNVHGISDKGKLFDFFTRKMLTESAEVAIGKEYYLLSRRKLTSFPGLFIKKICEKAAAPLPWHLYIIRAESFERPVAHFFRERDYLLTDALTKLQPIWPPYIEKPYAIQHDGDSVWLHMFEGKEVRIETNPRFNAFEKHFPTMARGRIFEVISKERQQLVSLGRTKVLQYMYFWRTDFAAKIHIPDVKVTDARGKSVLPGIMRHLPPEQTLCIEGAFAGKIVLRRRNIVIEEWEFQAGSPIMLSNLRMGDCVHVFQGLDIFWQIVFERLEQADDTLQEKDAETARKLASYSGEEMPMPHSWGHLPAKLQQYPQVRQWLHHQIRRSMISKAAFRHFRKFVSSLQEGF